MGALSIWHILILGAIALVLFGGKGKVSDLMGDFGRGINSFKKGLAESKDEPRVLNAEPAAEAGRLARARGRVHKRDEVRTHEECARLRRRLQEQVACVGRVHDVIRPGRVHRRAGQVHLDRGRRRAAANRGGKSCIVRRRRTGRGVAPQRPRRGSGAGTRVDGENERPADRGARRSRPTRDVPPTRSPPRRSALRAAGR